MRQKQNANGTKIRTFITFHCPIFFTARLNALYISEGFFYIYSYREYSFQIKCSVLCGFRCKKNILFWPSILAMAIFTTIRIDYKFVTRDQKSEQIWIKMRVYNIKCGLAYVILEYHFIWNWTSYFFSSLLLTLMFDVI